MPVLLIALALVQANAWFSSDTLYAKLKHRIDSATSSIDICFYDIDSNYITSALISAHNSRGVRVRVITEDDRLNDNWLWRLRVAGIPVWTDSIGPGHANLMHNKFAIFDYRDVNPANDWAWTGSLNVDAGSFSADNAIEIQDSGLAHAYTQEFEQMWGGSDSQPDPAHAEFHTGKTDRLSRHRFPVGDDTFLLYFNPQNHSVDTITRLASGAQYEIGFCIYSYTWRNLALAMNDRAQHAIWVGGVFDRGESTASYSYFDTLRAWDIPVYTDKFMSYGNLLHEKIMVIDRRIAVTGSANWSNAGGYSNDENTLVAISPAITERYRGEIGTRFDEAGGAYAQTDAGVVELIAPRGPVDTGAGIVPQARVTNTGPYAANFKAFLSIRDSANSLVYSDSTYVLDLPAQGFRDVGFSVWAAPHALGRYQVSCSTWAWGDTNPGNDVAQDSCRVVVQWSALEELPYGPRHKPVKAGGALAYAGSSDSGHVFALKGNRTNEFYRYDTRVSSWEDRESLPTVGRSLKFRRVGRGGALTGSGNRLFALKGNSSEFWSYDPGRASYAWGQLPDVPGRPVRDGASLATLAQNDTVYVYLLKGSGTREFYRFDSVSGSWETLAPVPRGTREVGYRVGSGIVTDGTGLIYAMKGLSGDFFAYDVASRTWTTKASLPLVGTSGLRHKVGAGAGLAYANGRVYCLKGNKSFEFWDYDCSADTWTQDFDFRGGLSVRAGGALTYAPPTNALYALSGGGSRMFRSYSLPPSGLLLVERHEESGVQSRSAVSSSQPALRNAPNPFSDATRISCTLPVSGNVSLKLYDIAGKLVRTVNRGFARAGVSDFEFRVSGFPAGVYMLVLETGSARVSRKLVLQ